MGNDNDYIVKLPLEKVNCNLCGSSNTKTILKEHCDLVRCKECGLVYYNPRPTPEALMDYYNSEQGYASYLRETKEPKVVPAHHFGLPLQMAFELTGHKESVLKVGSGYGNFLFFAKSQGWTDIHGIEPTAEAASFVRSKGIPVFTGTVREANFPNEKFNLVNMDHVLEHVPDPFNDLKEVARMLKKRGVVHICVPNISSFSFFVQRCKWVFKSFPNHLYYFSPNSLTKMLTKVGLEVVELTSGPVHSGEIEEKILSDAHIPRRFIPGLVSYISKKNWGASLICIARKPA
jgi:SAM-dependent methyltransferase